MKDYCLGAVETWDCEHDPALLPTEAAYFCSGVMVLNLKQWRQDNITDKLVRYLAENEGKIRWWDQDVLNGVLHGQWLPLHPTWDVNFLTKPKNYSNLVFSMEKSDYLSTIGDPAIYHFAGGKKPWHYLYLGPFAEEYFRYLSQTLWSNFRLVDVSVASIFKKLIMRTLRLFGMYEPMSGVQWPRFRS